MDLTHLAIPPWDLILRSTAIYVVLMIALRVFGKRELGQMTIFDLVLVLLVANAVQPAMTGPDSSLLGGFIIIGTLFILNWTVNWCRIRSPRFRRLLESPPRVLAAAGAWIPGALAKEGIDQSEADMALREHGVSGIDDTELVELESDGSVSVVPKQKAGRVRPRRRLRMLRRP